MGAAAKFAHGKALKGFLLRPLNATYFSFKINDN